MDRYLETALLGYKDFVNYLIKEISFTNSTWYINYFWALVLFSVVVYILEINFPWRKDQKKIRKDFWLDCFYMFFNFFIFKLVFFSPFSAVLKSLFTDILGENITKLSLLNLHSIYYPLQILIFFLAVDFVQWGVHVMLHKFSFLWIFHKVHHSVEQMGFAAHLRFHWMENIFYTPIKFIALLLLGGFEPANVFIIYYISIIIGHLNHANLNLSYGPLKYIFNNPLMHIWHHAEQLPEEHRFGMNFGISLSIWDYIFRTNYIPESGRDIKLGFSNMSKFPSTFFGQLMYPSNKQN